MDAGVIIVDHGSRNSQSNRLLHELVVRFGQKFGVHYPIIEPAHMELAEPSIGKAYARCVERGATDVIICPFFLGPGKHWEMDIPRLAGEAAARFPRTRFSIAPPLGIDDLMLQLLDKRIAQTIYQHEEQACHAS
jgi:sirohydrochlorin ferrochelatase